MLTLFYLSSLVPPIPLYSPLFFTISIYSSLISSVPLYIPLHYQAVVSNSVSNQFSLLVLLSDILCVYLLFCPVLEIFLPSIPQFLPHVSSLLFLIHAHGSTRISILYLVTLSSSCTPLYPLITITSDPIPSHPIPSHVIDILYLHKAWAHICDNSKWSKRARDERPQMTPSLAMSLNVLLSAIRFTRAYVCVGGGGGGSVMCCL